MFEEVNNQAAPVSASQPNSEPVATPTPAPAPISVGATVSPAEPAVQDIFANVETNTPSSPINSQPFGRPAMPAGVPANSQGVGQPVAKSGGLAKLILISLAILVVAGGGALAYLQYFKKTGPEIITPEPIVNQSSLLATSTEATAETAVVTSTEATSTEVATSTGEATSELGVVESGVAAEPTTTVTTDQPVEAVVAEDSSTTLDSDQDGLTDAEELNVYQTNPLKADTDGDGYLDGNEVKGGYNPLGEGKLTK